MADKNHFPGGLPSGITKDANIAVIERNDFMANILIVEDEKNMQDIIAEYMKKGGHTCFTADDGIDALMILKSNPMDLMILDIMMPHIDGFTVCKMAR